MPIAPSFVPFAMGNRTLVPPQSFCWNASCSAYGQLDQGNIRKFGHTPGGVQRYHCRICHHTFVETIGTVFYGRRRPNVIEQDHRFIKRRVKPGLGFWSYQTAWRTLQGYEAMNQLRKGQVQGTTKGDSGSQNRFIAAAFGLTA